MIECSFLIDKQHNVRWFCRHSTRSNDVNWCKMNLLNAKSETKEAKEQLLTKLQDLRKFAFNNQNQLSQKCWINEKNNVCDVSIINCWINSLVYNYFYTRRWFIWGEWNMVCSFYSHFYYLIFTLCVCAMVVTSILATFALRILVIVYEILCCINIIGTRWDWNYQMRVMMNGKRHYLSTFDYCLLLCSKRNIATLQQLQWSQKWITVFNIVQCIDHG